MSQLKRSEIERIFYRVQKPARYMGNELNSVVKEDAAVTMAISYPDLYEVGMSNNGIQILYNIANGLENVSCQRVFAVEDDFESLLRKENIPLFTLETFTPLNEVDIIGFNLAHELLYTNILQILDLGHVPILRAERDENDPVVIAGGASVSNPLPLFDFIDLFYIGDGEEGIGDILARYAKLKGEGKTRSEIMDSMTDIEGVLVTSRYEFVYYDTNLSGINGKDVQKRVYCKNEMMDPENPIVPNIRVAQERAVVEVTRGCVNLCKYCHAGYYDLPYRKYDLDSVEDKVFSILKNTGYNDLTLSSLSISDYPYLRQVINRILPRLTEEGVSISLPSLKVDRSTLPIIECISEIRRTSITLAVESGSDALRENAFKGVDIGELLTIIEHLHKKGWRTIKLYFMIGLPGYEDIDEAESIVALINRIREVTRFKIELNVTISPFVPKPHTPFQCEQQAGIDYCGEIIQAIKAQVHRKVKIKNHDFKASLLEGVFSRGDVRLGKVIYQSYMDGCRFDSWSEHFKFDIWEKNLDTLFPTWGEALLKKEDDTVLPWDRIKTGYEKLIKRMETRTIESGKKKSSDSIETPDVDKIHEARERFTEKYTTIKRIRICFTKTGKMRFIPHIDFVEIIKRGLRMVDAPVVQTQGFNKREKLATGYPVPLGFESISELCDVDLYEDIDDSFLDLLSARLPEGIEALKVSEIQAKEPLMAAVSLIEYAVTIESKELYDEIMEKMTTVGSFVKKTKKATREVTFHEVVSDYREDEKEANSFFIRMYAGTPESMRIDALLTGLTGKELHELYPFRIVKLRQYKTVDGEFRIME